MITYVFNKATQILEVTYEGIINSEDIIAYARTISKNKELPRKLKVLTDARNAEYHFDKESIYKLAELLEERLQNYEYIKDAFIHSKPKETALSVLLEIVNKHNNYFHKVFSTKEAALKWLT